MRNRHYACSTKIKVEQASLPCCPPSGTGKMPVPQNQGGTGILPVATIWNGQDARSTKIKVEQAILPVANHLERARCPFHNQAISCGTGRKACS
jgi:hypothetical protein